MTEREKKIITDRLIPVPQHIEFQDGNDYIIADGCRVKLTLPDDSGCRELVERLFKSYWKTISEVQSFS